MMLDRKLLQNLFVILFITMPLHTNSSWAIEDSANLAIVPLFDGRRSETLNTWGGGWSKGNVQAIGVLKDDLPDGRQAIFAELGQVKAGESRYVQCFASGFGKNNSYYQTRNLTRYQNIKFSIKNKSAVVIRGIVRIKDYRDTS